MSDPLVDAIVANPDDDAPRLVWADREGGERGELVVLQCALSYRNLDDETRRRYLRREKELLAAHRDAWTGGLGIHAHCSFRRGFVDHIHVDAIAPLLERIDRVDQCAPLLSGLQIDAITDDAHPSWASAIGGLERVLRRFDDRLGKLRLSLRAPGHYCGDSFIQEVLVDGGWGKNLGELELMTSGVTSAALPRLTARQRLTSITFGHHTFDGAAIVDLVDRLPNLQFLSLMYGLRPLNRSDVDRLIASKRLKQVWLSLHQTETGDDDRKRLAAVFANRVKF